VDWTDPIAAEAASASGIVRPRAVAEAATPAPVQLDIATLPVQPCLPPATRADYDEEKEAPLSMNTHKSVLAAASHPTHSSNMITEAFICRDNATGICFQGDACPFDHDNETPPGAWLCGSCGILNFNHRKLCRSEVCMHPRGVTKAIDALDQPSTHPQHTMELCPDFPNCPKGAACTHLHAGDEIKPVAAIPATAPAEVASAVVPLSQGWYCTQCKVKNFLYGACFQTKRLRSG
jgi:hypothetical protein